MENYKCYRSWMYDRMYPGRRGLKPLFEEGVKLFITWAFDQECCRTEGGVRCPCLKCGCRRIISDPKEVETHLKRKGFKENYWVWTSNGEEMPMNMPETSNFQHGSSSRSQMEYEEQFNLHDDMIGDALGVNAAYDEQQDSDEEELPNEKAQNFYELLKEINTPLFEGSSDSKLSMCVRLLAAKSNWNVPDQCLEFFCQMMLDATPTKDNLPRSYYDAKRLVMKLVSQEQIMLTQQQIQQQVQQQIQQQMQQMQQLFQQQYGGGGFGAVRNQGVVDENDEENENNADNSDPKVMLGYTLHCISKLWACWIGWSVVVEDIISKIESLHNILEVLPSSSSYGKLISYCCGMHKVDAALDIVDKMCEAGYMVSTHMLQSILQICEETYDYILVHRIYSIISRHHHHLELNGEICRFLIHFCVRLKDFERAYEMVKELQEMNFKPTTAMYNAIMAGYFREKNIVGGLAVLKHMQDANVDPDSQTFSYLISNCETEDDINMYYEELKQFDIYPTRQIFMALINAYAACGELEKAKQVVLDSRIPLKCLNEIKIVLVSALASHGQLSEALAIYEEIKKAGHNLEPKAVITLIDELRHISGELEGLLLLLKELSDLNYWVDGCFRVIQYCVQNCHLSCAVDLFTQLKDNFESDETMTEVLFDAVYSLIAGSSSSRLQFGLDLLWAIKDELGLVPSRQCLDFLLSACANSGDLNNSRLIWREYEVAGFPYNVLSYVRMYQALLASGDQRSADFILKKIPRDDAEICTVISACQKTYVDKVKSVEEEKKKKNVKSVEGAKKKKNVKLVEGEMKKKNVNSVKGEKKRRKKKKNKKKKKATEKKQETES